MPAESFFCSTPKIPGLDHCLLMTEWEVIWQASGIIIGLIIAASAGVKFLRELKNLRLQREEAASFERTEFFLSQHRRLFDDVTLFGVLCHLDGDNETLAEEDFWDGNRKFLTFIEEIQLLINSKKLKADVCYYMFGHYALCARDGKNFNVGIDSSRAHWKIFHDFCDAAEDYRNVNPNGPETLSL